MAVKGAALRDAIAFRAPKAEDDPLSAGPKLELAGFVPQAWQPRSTGKVRSAPLTESELDGFLVGKGGATLPPGTPLETVARVQPKKGNSDDLGIYVNGVACDAKAQSLALQDLADHSGRAMIGVHSATGGIVTDVGRATLEKLGLGGSKKAIAQMKNAIVDCLDKQIPLTVFAHSQGALVVSSALYEAQKTLIRRGMSKEQAEKQMSGIQVETFATASASFPDGPQYVHYLNDKDPVAWWFGTGDPKDDHTAAIDLALRRVGLSSHVGDKLHEWVSTQHPGRGAVVIHFSDDGTTAAPNQSMAGHRLATYLAHRIPFDEARARGAPRDPYWF